MLIEDYLFELKDDLTNHLKQLRGIIKENSDIKDEHFMKEIDMIEEMINIVNQKIDLTLNKMEKLTYSNY